MSGDQKNQTCNTSSTDQVKGALTTYLFLKCGSAVFQDVHTVVIVIGIYVSFFTPCLLKSFHDRASIVWLLLPLLLFLTVKRNTMSWQVNLCTTVSFLVEMSFSTLKLKCTLLIKPASLRKVIACLFSSSGYPSKWLHYVHSHHQYWSGDTVISLLENKLDEYCPKYSAMQHNNLLFSTFIIASVLQHLEGNNSTGISSVSGP